MISLGVLCSGELGLVILGNLLSTNDKINFVLTDKGSNSIIEFCNDNEIPCFVGNPRTGNAYHFVKQFNIEVILSVNYLFLINENIINHSKILTFNIHGSLLPKYRGRTPHVWAIINDEEEVGVTAHKIDAGCDTGDILKQITIPLSENDTGADVLVKYKNNYSSLIGDVLDDVRLNRLKAYPQNDKFATYYGKRTPEDGEIDWDWSKRRIYNWVRAQANPYPGAFTIHKGEKIIIDEINFSRIGYDFRVENGTVIHVSPIVVKVSDGAVELKKVRTSNVIIEKGIILKKV